MKMDLTLDNIEPMRRMSSILQDVKENAKKGVMASAEVANSTGVANLISDAKGLEETFTGVFSKTLDQFSGTLEDCKAHYERVATEFGNM